VAATVTYDFEIAPGFPAPSFIQRHPVNVILSER